MLWLNIIGFQRASETLTVYFKIGLTLVLECWDYLRL